MNPFSRCTLPVMALVTLSLPLSSIVTTGFILPPPPHPLRRVAPVPSLLSDPEWLNDGATYDQGLEVSWGGSGNDFGGARIPRSCNDYNIKQLYSQACGMNHYKKRSVPTGTPIATSSSSLHQLAPISFNIVVLEYFLPSSTSTLPSTLPSSPLVRFAASGSQKFLPQEPSSNHLNFGHYQGWDYHGGGEGEMAMVTQHQIVFPFHLYPDDLESQFSTWSQDYADVGMGHFARRAPEGRDAEIDRIKKKCCSPGGCEKRDFVRLC